MVVLVVAVVLVLGLVGPAVVECCVVWVQVTAVRAVGSVVAFLSGIGKGGCLVLVCRLLVLGLALCLSLVLDLVDVICVLGSPVRPVCIL